MTVNTKLLSEVYSLRDKTRRPRANWLIGFHALATVRIECPQLLDGRTTLPTTTIAGLKFKETNEIPVNEIHLVCDGTVIGIIET